MVYKLVIIDLHNILYTINSIQESFGWLKSVKENVARETTKYKEK